MDHSTANGKAAPAPARRQPYSWALRPVPMFISRLMNNDDEKVCMLFVMSPLTTHLLALCFSDSYLFSFDHFSSLPSVV